MSATGAPALASRRRSRWFQGGGAGGFNASGFNGGGGGGASIVRRGIPVVDSRALVAGGGVRSGNGQVVIFYTA